MNFALVLAEEGPPFRFQAMAPDSLAFLQAHQEIFALVRAFSETARGTKETDECMALGLARDLERTLRIVTKESDLSVTAMKQVRRQISMPTNPWTGLPVMSVSRVSLEEIVAP